MNSRSIWQCITLVFGLLLAGHVRAQAPPTFSVGSTNGLQGAQVLVPVQVVGFTNMNTFQFAFHWDPTNASFVDVPQIALANLTAGNFGLAHTNAGVLTVSWDDPNQNAPNGQFVPDGTVIFAVRLTLIGTNGSPPSPVQIDGSFIPIEVTTRTNGAAPDDVTTASVFNPGQLTIGEPNTPPLLSPIG